MQRAARIAFVIAACFSFVMAALPHPPPIPGEPSDKIMHMLAFATLGGLAAYGFPRRSVILLLFCLGAFGALIELVQSIPMLHRDSDVIDLVADIAAALFALTVTRWAMTARGRQRSVDESGG